MHGHRVLTVDLRGRSETVAELDDKPSGIGFLPDGTPIVVLMRRRQIVRLATGGVRGHADLSSIAGHDLNDMVVDREGRAYVGNRFKRGDILGTKERAAPSSPEGIVLVMPDGVCRVVADSLFSPNGIVITPDAKTLIVALSRSHRLVAFDVEEDGRLANRRLFAQTGSSSTNLVLGRDPSPDGICLDAEGAIWFGSPLTGEFIRILEGGQVTDRIQLPDGRWAVACSLGDADRRTLFLVSARASLENMATCVDYESDKRSTASGRVEVVQVDVPGRGWP
jgi:sugar lactone lactonase YvrE